MVFASVLLVGCGNKGGSTFDPPRGTDGGSDAAVGAIGEDASLIQGEPDVTIAPGVARATYHGRVTAPDGKTPVFQALVYMVKNAPPPMPDGVYCDRCVELESTTPYALTDVHGEFTLRVNEEGAHDLVIQKGGFRRVRPTFVRDGEHEVDASTTKLPSKRNKLTQDDIPKILIGTTIQDNIEETFSKLGLDVIFVERAEEDSDSIQVVRSWETMLDATMLSHQHMVFVPCTTDAQDMWRVERQELRDNLRTFAKAGGRVYITDWSYDWLTRTWPGYATIQDKASPNPVTPSDPICKGCMNDHWDAPATSQDADLSAWLSEVSPNTPFVAKGNFSRLLSVQPAPGEDIDGNPVSVTPKVWVTAETSPSAGGPMGSYPTTISFPDKCGKVLFSTYHTEGNTADLLPQEKALFYLVLETSVCVGPPGGVVVR